MHHLDIRTRAYELLQYRLQGLALRSGLNVSRPTFICIKLTMRCNARCRHCDIYKPEHAIPELTTEQWIGVLRRLRSWLGAGAPITVTGGEILLRRDLFEVLGAARDLELSLYLLTNGWLVNEARATALLELDPRVVQVSLDGVSDGTHDFLRGLEGFGKRARHAIELLSAAKRACDASTDLVLNVVIFKQNLDEVADVARWAREHGIDSIKYQPIEQTYMEPHDPRWFERSPLWIDDTAAAHRVIDQLIHLKGEGYPIHNTVDSLEFMKHYFADPLALQKKVVSHDQHLRSRSCRSAVADFDIDANGDVRLCYRMDPIGNVAERDPRDIWNNRPRCWTRPCRFLEDPLS
ncbi:MAG: radical SAM protein [Candidatus Eiseniibacteriota bacterium]|jgi:MoaA/NifB/PqqE/SkfB family radical SAM enzyme